MHSSFNGGAYHQSQKGKLLITSHPLEVREWWNVLVRVSARQTAVLVRNLVDFVVCAATGTISAAWITRRNNNNKVNEVILSVVTLTNTLLHINNPVCTCIWASRMHSGVYYASRDHSINHPHMHTGNPYMHMGIITHPNTRTGIAVVPISVCIRASW